jgi:hypothetical protein
MSEACADVLQARGCAASLLMVISSEAAIVSICSPSRF